MPQLPLLNKQSVIKLVFESSLIVFSVLLALFLNEYRGQVKDAQTRDFALSKVTLELEENLVVLNDWYEYHQNVLKNYRQALDDPDYQKSLVSEEGIVYYQLMPKGVVQQLVDNSAWQALKVSPTYSSLDFELTLTLSKIYKLQENGVEQTLKTILEILSSREVLQSEKLEENLILLHRSFAELVSQEQFLIQYYNKTLTDIKSLRSSA